MKNGKYSPYSYRQLTRALTAWGFVREGGSGGHEIWSLNGKRVQIAGPGRHVGQPRLPVRKAAAMVGVGVSEFVAGPPRRT